MKKLLILLLCLCMLPLTTGCVASLLLDRQSVTYSITVTEPMPEDLPDDAVIDELTEPMAIEPPDDVAMDE